MRLDKYRGNPLYTDELTGLLNKRFLNELINTQRTYAVICIFDIDDFKSVNDIYGHYTGDITIRDIGELIRHMFNEPDIIAIRFGGDEFILIFPDNTVDFVTERINELMHIIRNNTIHSGAKTVSITCSFGIAEGYLNDFEHIMNSADKALYISKDRGKNRLTVYSENLSISNAIPCFVDRRLKTLVNKGHNIILSGGCCTGKHTCIDQCIKKAADYNVYDEFRDFRQIREPFIIINNPAFMESTGNTEHLFRIRKQYKPDELLIDNMSKTVIKSVLARNNQLSSLLAVNYADLISSGNISILSRIVKSNVFDASLYDARFDRGIYSHLSKRAQESINSILKLGLRFTAHDAKLHNKYNLVKYLNDIMIVEYAGREYRYCYPPLYFLLSGYDGASGKYKHVFSLASMIKQKSRAEYAEMIFEYGDVCLAENILSKCEKNDDYFENMAMIKSEYSEFDEAIEMSMNINDEKKRTRMIHYVKLKQGKNPGYINSNDTRSLLLNMNSALISNDNNLYSSYNGIIKKRVLDEREKIAVYSVISSHERMKQDLKNALKFLKKAQFIALKNHYLADYAKILMNIGIVLDDMNELSSALRYFTRAYKIFELTNLADFMESTMLNMAVVYTRMANYGKAVHYFSELLTGKRSTNSIYFRTIVLHNLAELYLREWDVSNALKYNESVIELLKSQQMQIPDYIKILHMKICKVMDISVDIEYDKINDIINNIERRMLENNESSLDNICADIINADMSIDDKCDCLSYLALLKRYEPGQKKAILQQACNILSEKKDIMRLKQLNALMEE